MKKFPLPFRIACCESQLVARNCVENKLNCAVKTHTYSVKCLMNFIYFDFNSIIVFR